MKQIKTEVWMGHTIRFVEKNPGEWWAVLTDICAALDLSPKHVRNRLPDEVVSSDLIEDTLGRTAEMLVANEEGIYEAMFGSRKKEAKDFRRWVYRLLKDLREATGLEAFQIFRMLDKEHQKEAMRTLHNALNAPGKPDFIKANTIADKAVSTRHGHPKMLKKADMTPAMLVDRQPILDDTVELMGAVDKYGLPISVSKTIYARYQN
jgi:prophage antirepressor-like protein